jgi:hypothetical protein
MTGSAHPAEKSGASFAGISIHRLSSYWVNRRDFDSPWLR